MLLEISIIILVVFIGVVTQRVAGFGMPLFVIPTLLLFFSPAEAVTMTLLLGIVSSFFIFFELKEKTTNHWRIILSIFPALLLGIIVGSYTITIVEKSILQIVLGVLIVVTVNVQEHFSPKKLKKLEVNPQLHLVSLVAGFFNATVALAGAPFVIWLRMHVIKPDQIRIFLAVLFIITNIFSISAIALFDPEIFNHEYFSILLVVLPFIFFANFLGKNIANKINKEVYAKIVYMLLTVTGIICMYLGFISI